MYLRLIDLMNARLRGLKMISATRRAIPVPAIALMILITNAPTAVAAACKETHTYVSSLASNPLPDETVQQIAKIRFGVDNLANCCSGDHPGLYLFRPALLQLQHASDEFLRANGVKNAKQTDYCGESHPSELDPKVMEDNCTYCKLNKTNQTENCATDYGNLHQDLLDLAFQDKDNEGNEGVVCMMNDLIDNPKSTVVEIDAARNLALALYTALGSLDGTPADLYTPFSLLKNN